MLRFRTIGGHDLRSLSGRRVAVHAHGGPVFGVIGQRPVHLVRDRNRSAPPPQAHDLWIDCGFAGHKEAVKLIEIGDPVTYIEGFQLLRNKLAVARGFDNRVGAFIVAETLRALAQTKTLKARVSAVATVQEEIGLRGAKTSAFGLDPDAGLAVDVTWATDNPGGDPKEIGDVRLGAGPVLVRGPNVNPPLHRLLKSTASKLKISLQHRSIPGASGTDANPLQLTRAGVATALVSIPNRYMHSPVEMCHLGDIEAAVKLIAGTIKTLGPKTSFIPD
jgi:endoglucanase